MAGLFNKAKNAVIGENNDHHSSLPTAAPRGEPTIGTNETTPARGLNDGPQAASGLHSHPRATDNSGAFNARGINNNPIGGIAQQGASTTTDTSGPHNSNVANKLDPRVDSDRNGRAGVGLNSGNNAGFGSQHQPGATSGYGSTTTAGPHGSNIANKMDPRVDSDRDGRGAHGAGATGGMLGSQTHGSTNAGPHNSNVANKLDPRVDSDRDGRGAHGTTHSSTTGGALNTPAHSAYDSKAYSGTESSRHGQPHEGVYNPHGNTASAALGLGSHNANNTQNQSTNAGPHNSNVANKLDPRVDSDLDGRGTHGTHQGSHNGRNAALAGAAGAGAYGANHHNNQPTNAGPHDSNAANKFDPRVDSDRDGRAAHGSTTTGTHGTHSSNVNSSATALGAGPGGLGLGQNTAGTHAAGKGTSGLGNNYNSTNNGPHNSNTTNKLDPRVDSDRDGRGIGHGTDYPQKYEPLVTSIPGTHANPPGAPLSKPPVTTGTGTHGSTNAGPHNSNAANKLDPRVDSDRDSRAAHGNTTTGTHGTHSNNRSSTAGGTGTHTGAGAHGSNLPGPAPNTAGPHKKDILNKLDPKVDSDMDGKAKIMS